MLAAATNNAMYDVIPCARVAYREHTRFPGIDAAPNTAGTMVEGTPILRVYSGRRTERTEVPGTGVKKYRTYPSVGYRYRKNIDLTEVSGTGIEKPPNLPKCRGSISRPY